MEKDFKEMMDELLDSGSKEELLAMKNGIETISNIDSVSVVEGSNFSPGIINIYNRFISILSSKSYAQDGINYRGEDLYYGPYFIGNSENGLNNSLKEVFCNFLETDFLDYKLNMLPYFEDISGYGLSYINISKLNDLLAIIDPADGKIYSYYRKEIYKTIGVNKKYIKKVETVSVIYEIIAEIAQEYTNRYAAASRDDYNRVLSL